MENYDKFELDIQTIRKNARKNILEGAVTPSYKANKLAIINLLNHALATELVCMLRYRAHAYMCFGIDSQKIREEFLVHAAEELAHADQLAERIVQLGGEANFSPVDLQSRAHAEYVVPKTLKEMILENLVAERIAVSAYSEMIRYIGDSDPTTRKILEEILMQEETHADELSDWLED